MRHVTGVLLVLVWTSGLHAQVWGRVDMTSPRANHTLTVLPDGRVLALGGFDSQASPTYPNSTYEFLDEATMGWTSSALPPGVVPRARHTATVLNDGRVLVTGGYTNVGGITTNTCDIYDPVTDVWVATDSLAQARQSHAAVKLDDGSVLVVGGGTTAVERFDPATETWSSAGSLAEPRHYNSTTKLLDGRVLVAGGIYFSGTMFLNSDSAELFDPEKPIASAWSTVQTSEPGFRATLDPPRQWHAAHLMPSGNVLIVGGLDGSLPLASTELFDVQHDAWVDSPLPGISEGRILSTTAALGSTGQVLVIGGALVDDSVNPPAGIITTDVEMSTPSGAWLQTAPALTPRFWQTSVSLPGGRVLVTGGYDQSLISQAILTGEIYAGQQAGDVNQDGASDIGDAIALFDYLFPVTGGPVSPPLLAVADINGDGLLDIADPIYMLNYLFSGGTEPAFVP
ncbi:MAG: kelch repeat-containing protein [Planctomycetota bacterium]